MQIPWTEIIIAICTVVTTAGSIIWIMTREFASVRKEISDESKAIRGEMANEFKEVRADLRSLDARVSRIEGYITGRDYNENRKIS